MLGEGLRILVAEDNWFIAQDIASTLMELGYTVVGPALTLAQAQRLAAEDGIDGAVLDLRLGDGLAATLALDLARRGKWVLVISGAEPPREVAGLGTVPKPFSRQELEDALATVFGEAAAVNAPAH